MRMQRLSRLVDARPCGNVSRIPTTHCVLSRDGLQSHLCNMLMPEKVTEQSIKVTFCIFATHTSPRRFLALHGQVKTPYTWKSRGPCSVVSPTATGRMLTRGGPATLVNQSQKGTRRAPSSRSIGQCLVSRVRTSTAPIGLRIQINRPSETVAETSQCVRQKERLMENKNLNATATIVEKYNHHARGARETNCVQRFASTSPSWVSRLRIKTQ